MKYSPHKLVLTKSESPRIISPQNLSLPALEAPNRLKEISTADGKSIFFKLPIDFSADFKSIFPYRPEDSSLSGLTVRENERFSFQNSSLISLSTRSLTLKSAEPNIKLPSEQDFEKILTKLELVCSNKNTGHRRIILHESETTEILLEKGTIQYFTIQSINKSPPMSISLKKKRGKLLTYVSKSSLEPTKINCDIHSAKDSLQVNDINLKFKNESFFIGIEALVDSEFSIIVNFGSRKHKKRLSFKLNFEENLLDRDEDFYFPEVQTERVRRPDDFKDFIKINKNNSKLRVAGNAFSARHEEWKIRRENALQKRSKHLELKKQKTIHKIKKYEEKRKTEQKALEQIQIISLFKAKQKHWTTIMSFASSILFIKELIEKERAERLESLKVNLKARSIQQVFRRTIGSNSDLLMQRACKLLRFYCQSVVEIYKHQLTKCIKNSRANHIVPFSFKKFIEKVLLIQRKWHEYDHRTKMRWDALEKLWNSVLEEKLMKFGRSNSKRKKERESRRLVKIPVSIKNSVLRNYIKEYTRNYLDAVRLYKENKRRLIEKIIRKMSTLSKTKVKTNKKQRIENQPPVFNIIPTPASMQILIEKAIKLSES